MDDLVSHYYTLLLTAKNPGVELCKFYSEVLGIEQNYELVGYFNKMCKVYGKFSVLMSVAALADFDNVDIRKIRGLLSWLIRKQVEKKFAGLITNSVDLSKEVSEREKILDKVRKKKITMEDPFD